MSDPLSLLRKFHINKKEIIERDDKIIFGELTCDKNVETNCLIWESKKGAPKIYYTLQSLLFFLKNTELNHAEYVKKATAAKLPVVRRPVRKEMLGYLSGATPTCAYIDKSVPLQNAFQDMRKNGKESVNKQQEPPTSGRLNQQPPNSERSRHESQHHPDNGRPRSPSLQRQHCRDPPARSPEKQLSHSGSQDNLRYSDPLLLQAYDPSEPIDTIEIYESRQMPNDSIPPRHSSDGNNPRGERSAQYRRQHDHSKWTRFDSPQQLDDNNRSRSSTQKHINSSERERPDSPEYRRGPDQSRSVVEQTDYRRGPDQSSSIFAQGHHDVSDPSRSTFRQRPHNTHYQNADVNQPPADWSKSDQPPNWSISQQTPPNWSRPDIELPDSRHLQAQLQLQTPAPAPKLLPPWDQSINQSQPPASFGLKPPSSANNQLPLNWTHTSLSPPSSNSNHPSMGLQRQPPWENSRPGFLQPKPNRQQQNSGPLLSDMELSPISDRSSNDESTYEQPPPKRSKVPPKKHNTRDTLGNEYNIFGKHVASELNKMSEHQAIIAQEQIQAVISRCRLNNLLL